MALIETQQVEPGRFVCTPHPVLLDGQTNIAAELRPGESLYAFLARNVPDFHDDAWEVKVGGVLVPAEHWHRVKPKHGQMIEAHGAVKKQALYIVAMAALMYFTFGAGSVVGLGGAYAGLGAYVAAGVIYAAGAIVINKVLGPKPPDTSGQAQPDAVYSLGAARNRPRPYEPWPLLFGSVQVTPDLLSAPYSWHQGDDQHIGMVLNAGINVDRIDALSNGETLLSSYDEVEVYTAGMPGMPEQDIPLYSNADTTSGGELTWEGDWVERTTSPDTVRIVIGLEYLLYDNDNDGKPYYNQETVVAEYRLAGTTTWLTLAARNYRYNKPDTKRASLTLVVPRGQYDVRVHRLGRAGKEKGAFSQFQWTTLTSVQYDATDYSGAARIGIGAKATGQLQGPMDEIRGVAHAKSMPIWDGTAWQTATTRENGLSNPGAQILKYARGFYSPTGALQAGLGLDDEQIDIAALQAFMLHCAAEGYTYDACIKGVRSHDEMLNAIALAGFGQITWAGGKLSVAWAADEQPLGGVVNMATIKRGQFQVDYTLANSADGIEYTYFDRETWQPQTLRVPAPGVTTMLNPATITGEGVTTEAHAAQLARYHLAQHLYQYKSISYSTDLEHLSYRRLTPLALQHDLTRWGHGGRVMAAVDNAGTVTLTLDEPVPAPTSGNAYIGLRIPGEQVYRVFQIAAFTGESDTITLAEPWPIDAALPGDASDNPAHDTIWIYDFKQTPGYRVRVVDIAPESGLKGASVAVVPEPPEFWTYVKTGEYQVPALNPLLPKLPTATNLQVSESRTVQGDTVFTELTVNFDVTGGKMAYATVHAAYYVDHDAGYAELVEVAQTNTGTAKFRIGAAGTYAIVVRPYNADGVVGGVASTTYTTTGAEVAPPAFDYFTVTELDGGVRKYAFGYDGTTTPPPDLAGAEIRYITGNVPAPDWAAMTPLGEDGFFTSAVEMVVPPSGLWTFAARPRTTGKLLGPLSIVTATLAENLGEITGQTGAEIAQIVQDQLQDAQDLADEIIARQQADADAALERAQLVADQAVLRAQIGDILQADVHSTANEYPEGDLVQSGDPAKLYRALQDVPVGIAITNAAYWELVGNYASLGEAVSATAAQVEVHNVEIADIDGTLTAVSETVDQHAARMPSGTGTLGTDARITSVESAAAVANSATADSVSKLSASLSQTALLLNPDFELGAYGWQEHGYTINNPNLPLPANVDVWEIVGALVYTGSRSLRINPPASAVSTSVYNSNRFAVGVGEVVSGSIRSRTHYSSPPPSGTAIVYGVRFYDANNAYVSEGELGRYTFSGSENRFYPNSPLSGEVSAPTGAVYGRFFIRVSAEFYGAPGALYFDAAKGAKGPNTTALAQVVSATSATVSQHGDTLTAHTSQINSLQSSVSTLPVVYLQPAPPTGGSYNVGDMWLDSDDGNKVYVWNGSVWSASANVQGATVYAQTTAPGGSLNVGDLWFDTDNQYRMHRWNGSSWVDVTDERVAATASALSSLSNTVTQQGDDISTHSDQLVSLSNEIADKASSSALSSLSSEVDLVGDQVAANGTAITQVSASLAQKGEDAIRKGVFGADGGKGTWQSSWAVAPSSAHPVGYYLNVTSGGYEGATGDGFAVTPGEVFDLSADSYGGGMSSGSSSFGLQWLDKNNANISAPTAITTAAGQSWQYGKKGTLTAPAGAVRARGVIFYTGNAGGYAGWQNLRAIRRTAQVASLATASQSLRADVDSVTGKVNASYTLTLDANGRITGYEFQNDGTTGTMAILADKFSIVSPGGGARTEYSGGNWRIYDAAGTLRVQMGVGF